MTTNRTTVTAPWHPYKVGDTFAHRGVQLQVVEATRDCFTVEPVGLSTSGRLVVLLALLLWAALVAAAVRGWL